MDQRTPIKCFVTRIILKIGGHISCQMKDAIYVAYCLNSQNQGLGTAVSWKPHLRHYKSHIKNNVKSCKIVRHLIEECEWVSNLGFIINDVLSNVDYFSSEETDDLLLQKKVLDRYNRRTIEGVNCDPWLEENKAFPKVKVTEQINFFNPRFSIVYGNQLMDLRNTSTHWFLFSGKTGIENLN